MKKSNRILCFSAGLDSVIAWHMLEKPDCLYVKLNHRYQNKELHSINKLKQLIPELNITIIDGPDLSTFEIGPKAYISQRNLLLAVIAHYYGNKIYINGNAGDMVKDNSPKAREEMVYAMNVIQKPDELPNILLSPCEKYTKSELVSWFLKSYPREYCEKVLRASISCYDATSSDSCGNCLSCARKFVALDRNNIECIDWFKNDIRNWSGWKDEYEQRETYNKKRKEDIEETIKKHKLLKTSTL